VADAGDVDWESLHARIARARAQTQALLEPDAAAKRRILDERARRLARPLQLPSEQEQLECALFSVAGEHYAIETRYVTRITPLPAFEPIPWLPLPFLGVINHHGQPLPLIELRALLGAPTLDASLSFLLVLGASKDELGVAISAAEAVAMLPLADVDAGSLPESLRGVPFVRGLYQGGRLLLAGGALLEERRLTVTEAQ
jgi:purine-binding chemotaxis protein CheW